MQVLAGGTRFYWARALVAGFAVLSCLQWFGLNTLSFGGVTAGSSLGVLSGLGLILALASVVVTADCVSHERRDGTLPLLFLSNLKSSDVVLGKLAALGLVALYALLGFSPVLMVTLINGGVTGGEVARTVVVLMTILFVSLATGLLTSVIARNQFDAILGAVGLLAAVLLAPYFLDVIVRDVSGFRWSALLSPLAGLWFINDVNYASNQYGFWGTIALSHLVGWALLGLAMQLLARNWRRLHEPRAIRSAVAQSRRLIGAPRVLVAGRDVKRAVAPVARAVLRLPRQPALAWLAATVSVLGSIWNATMMNRVNSFWAGLAVSMIFTFISLGVFAFLAGRFFFEARRSGELELLLVTPVGARGILREQLLALLRILRGPFYFAVAGAIPVGVTALSLTNGREVQSLLLAFCHLASTALGIIAVCVVAMWLGSRVNSIMALVGWSVGLVEVLPLVLFFLLPMLPVAGNLFATGWADLVPILLVIKNPFFIWWAWHRLRHDFRTKDRDCLEGAWRRWFHPDPVPPVQPRPEPAS